ncbi:MAG TPA: DUF4258 domain-containing protein [Chloroflexia bacterium]|nr:DUF4258 domain-containing protein [Chloroflexia bacterium]
MTPEYRLTLHAIIEMARRGISEADVAYVLSAPEQEAPVRPGRKVYQSRIEMDDPPKLYLLRVFVDIDRKPPEVVTVYRTSKIDKYWEVDE